jgi:hypothetical protein
LRRLALAFSFAASLLLSTGGMAAADAGKVGWVAPFAPPNLPESVAVDAAGNVYASLPPSSKAIQVDAQGDQSTVGFKLPQNGALLGIAAEQRGNVAVVAFAPNASNDQDAQGLWRIGADGTKQLLAALPGAALPNDVVAAPNGGYYVTDSGSGSIWRVLPDGTAFRWAQDDLLKPSADACAPDKHPFPAPIGANGIAWDARGNLLASNTWKATIVRVPINPDGGAGAPSVWAGPDCEHLLGADGITADGTGGVFVANNYKNLVLQVGAGSAVRVLATAADGLDSPSSVKVGMGRLATRLIVSNFANPVLRAKDAGPPRPGIVALNPAAAAADPTDPAPLANGVVAAGTLGGRGGGTFAYYRFWYNGDLSPATVSMQVATEDQAALGSRQVGFNVYGPQKGTVYAASGGRGGLVPNLSADVNSTDKGVYLVQAFNYTGRDYDFQLWVTGAGVNPPTS